jgi:hypothetical protein
MVTTPAPPTAEVLDAPDGGDQHRPSMVESIMDNLSFWTVMSAAIGLLYLVWATIEILNRYIGHLPSVGP